MNRTVAVTGGSGKLGRAVVAALIVEGWTVVNFDRVPSPDSRAHFIRTDLTDYGHVVEALSGIDEVHSGVNAVGYPFNNPPAYVPLDENVPATPEVVYALAKDLEEEMARQYCRWNPDQKDDRAALLQRHRPVRVRRLPLLRKRPCLPQVEPVATSTPVMAPRSSSVRWNTTSRGSTTSSSPTPTAS